MKLGKKAFSFLKKLLKIISILIILFFIIMIVGRVNDKDEACLYDGYCEEGVSIYNTKINKKNCLENNWKWLEDKKACIIK